MKTAQEFVDTLNRMFTEHYAANSPDRMDSRPVFHILPGVKYTKVCDKRAGGPERNGSAFCFIDAEGNMFKAASWKAPAKGVRAQLSDMTEEHLMKTVVSTGYASTGWLYR